MEGGSGTWLGVDFHKCSLAVITDLNFNLDIKGEDSIKAKRIGVLAL